MLKDWFKARNNGIRDDEILTNLAKISFLVGLHFYSNSSMKSFQLSQLYKYKKLMLRHEIIFFLILFIHIIICG